MRPNTFGIHFIIRNNRVDKNGNVPIYAKVLVNGKTLLLSLNHTINSKDWDKGNEQPKQNYKKYDIINDAIKSFKSRVYLAYSKIVASNLELTATNLN